MSDAESSNILNELRALRADLAEVLNLPEDAKAALAARQAAQARGYHTVNTLAACIGAHPHTVSDRCRTGTIRTLDTPGKGYRIPLSEEQRINEGK